MLKKIKELSKRVKMEVGVYQAILKDKETPQSAKFFLGLMIAYALSPIDFIPDFVPIFGHLDDAIVLPVLFVIALKLIPKKVIEKHRKKLSQLSK